MRLAATASFGFVIIALLHPAALEAQLTGAHKAQLLDLHNLQERCGVIPPASAMPPLVWDFRLATVAQNYANTCPGLVHNANRNADYAAQGGSGQVGENIADGSSGFTPAMLYQFWADEKASYSQPTNTCLPGQVCGHYTQIVWANTLLVGCGMATACTGTFSQQLICNYAPAGNFVGQAPYAAGAGPNTSCGATRSNFNAERGPDIVLRNYTTGQNAVWLMNGTTLNSIADLPALPDVNWIISGTADFNFDGESDILLRNQVTGQDAVWLMNNTTLTSIVDLPALPNVNYFFEGTGDFNADGKPDIILRNYVTGQNALWVMNGTSFSSIVDLPALPNTSYRIESAGDFNGDGKTDIVLRNYTTGQNALWIMNGTTLQSTVDLPGLTNTSYRIDGVGDFNSDLRPDIVWRNGLTGQNAVWIMNGTALSGIADLPALPNTAYQINGPR